MFHSVPFISIFHHLFLGCFPSTVVVFGSRTGFPFRAGLLFRAAIPSTLIRIRSRSEFVGTATLAWGQDLFLGWLIGLLWGGIGHLIGRYDDWVLVDRVAVKPLCAGVQFEWTASICDFWQRWWLTWWRSPVSRAVSHLLLRGMLVTRSIAPNNVRGRGARNLRHPILLLVVLRPWHVVEAPALVHLLHLLLGLRKVLVLPALVRHRSLVDFELVLALHCRLAPGDSKPTAVDGDALQLAQGHQRIAPLLKLNEGIALEGPVHVSNLAERLEEVPEPLIGHGIVDAANEQGRICPVGGELAGPVRWRRWYVAWWVANVRRMCVVHDVVILHCKLEQSFRNGVSGEDWGRICLLGCEVDDNRNRDKGRSYRGCGHGQGERTCRLSGSLSTFHHCRQ